MISKFIHRRTEGDEIYRGINWMNEKGYWGVYLRFKRSVLKFRWRYKWYRKKCGLKPIYFAHYRNNTHTKYPYYDYDA